VQILRVVLLQNYTVPSMRGAGGGQAAGQVLRRRGRSPAAMHVTSPYDTDARWSVKRDVFWNGFKLHTPRCNR